MPTTLRRAALALVATATIATALAAQSLYFPAKGKWERRSPAQVGLDSAALARAVEFAKGADNGWPTDIGEQIRKQSAKEPYPDIVGPVKDRAQTNGVVIKNG